MMASNLEDNLTLQTARVSMSLWAYPELDDSEQILAMMDRYSANKNSLLKVNQVKVYMDGILESRQALN